MKVLLIEDNPGDARLVWEMLREDGADRFELAHVEQLDEGLKCLYEETFDVLLLDLNLPDSQGLETLNRAYAQASGVPIVVLTVLADVALGIEAVKRGAQDYLVKEQVDGNLLMRSIYYAIERKRAEEERAYMATHDALTGLPNRILFNDRLNQEIARAYRHHQKLAVMMLDLDRFKDVNDTLGHSVGDQLLQAVGERLTYLLRKSDTVARMDSDEFMLIIPEIAWAEDTTRVAQRILDAFREPFVCDGRELYITTSIGIAIYPYDGEDADTLIQNADIAMYRAKEEGRDNYQRYTPAMNAKAVA